MTKAGELFTCHRCKRTIKAKADAQYPLGAAEKPVVVCGQCLERIVLGRRH